MEEREREESENGGERKVRMEERERKVRECRRNMKSRR